MNRKWYTNSKLLKKVEMYNNYKTLANLKILKSNINLRSPIMNDSFVYRNTKYGFNDNRNPISCQKTKMLYNYSKFRNNQNNKSLTDFILDDTSIERQSLLSFIKIIEINNNSAIYDLQSNPSTSCRNINFEISKDNIQDKNNMDIAKILGKILGWELLFKYLKITMIIIIIAIVIK